MTEIRNHWLGKRIYAQAEAQMQGFFSDDDNPVVAKMGQAFLADLPLRTLQTMSQGALTDKRLDLIIAVMNGHWGRALMGFVRR